MLRSLVQSLAVLTLAHGAAAMKIAFTYSGPARVVPIQEFGARGGFVNVSLSVFPVQCDGVDLALANATDCWDSLDFVYLALFSLGQWQNLTRRVHSYGDDGLFSCAQISAGWSSVSALAWQQSQACSAIDSSTACLGLGGLETVSPAVDYAMPPLHQQLIPLQFSLRYAIPHAHDLYTLALYNCRGEQIRISGNATFAGGAGERLSTREFSVLTVHTAFLLTTLVLACGYLYLMCRHRATALPLHALLVVVLLLRVVQESFLLLPIVLTIFDYPIAPSAQDYLATSSTAEARAAANAEADGATAYPMPVDLVDPDGANLAAVQQCSAMGAAVSRQLSSIAFLTALLALAGGRHFLAPILPAREREALTTAFLLYLIFGVIAEVCTREVLCSVFVLSFQVVKILLVFGVLIFLNAAADALRRSTGHQWDTLKGDLSRLLTFRQVRHLLPSRPISSHLRPSPPISDHLRPSPPISSHLLPSPPISGYLSPSHGTP